MKSHEIPWHIYLLMVKPQKNPWKTPPQRLTSGVEIQVPNPLRSPQSPRHRSWRREKPGNWIPILLGLSWDFDGNLLDWMGFSWMLMIFQWSKNVDASSFRKFISSGICSWILIGIGWYFLGISFWHTWGGAAKLKMSAFPSWGCQPQTWELSRLRIGFSVVVAVCTCQRDWGGMGYACHEATILDTAQPLQLGIVAMEGTLW